jgi:hypothetical protein
LQLRANSLVDQQVRNDVVHQGDDQPVMVVDISVGMYEG